MDITQIIQAIILGIVEGLTEFLPISSTAHLILVADLMGFNATPGKVFEIAIQLGSILAVCWKFRAKFFEVSCNLKQKKSQRFILNILLAFLPAAIIGLMFRKEIQEVFFNQMTIAITLILGGVVIIIIENAVKKVRFETVDDIDNKTALKIGFFQAIAMIPGVSRSGATIMGSLLMGASRKAAAEFSFFLAIPTMIAATFYDLYKNWDLINADAAIIIMIGFITAFVSALLVVSKLIDFVSKKGFKPFAYYRIVLGSIILLTLAI